GDFDWATFDHPTLPFPTLGSVSQHWIATAAARVGVVEDRWLVDGKNGGGWECGSPGIPAFIMIPTFHGFADDLSDDSSSASAGNRNEQTVRI
ncbi:MAG: hypothetical protein WAV38_01660, partial [Xanthobacteraceae bacterium]